MRKFSIFIITIVLSFILLNGCTKKKVNRDYIPIIKENLYKLQLAVKNQNLAQIDSLMSIKILDKEQSSDSLLRYVYGADYNSFEFVQFGNAEIIYTNENARVTCYVMDSSATSDRPLVFFLANEDELWLFTSFADEALTDSLQLD